MKAFWIGLGVVGVGLALAGWGRHLARRSARAGKAPMSDRWLTEHVYEKNGDRRWK